MEEKSIYQKIVECVVEHGEIPKDFVVEEREYSENELRFAPGTLEGVFGHHLTTESDTSVFLEKLKGFLQISPEVALQAFEALESKDFRTASMRAGIFRGVTENREDYDSEALATMACHFIEYGNTIESVKLGLTLLAFFDWSQNKQVRDMVKVLGYCEDFTNYVVVLAERWEMDEKQELYYELARKLKGWGKINVVDRMRADSAEKQDWLLCHGCQNYVRYSYLARICAVKSYIIERMKSRTFDDEEFAGATAIMEGLLDEGPCPGMSAMEKPVELTLLYLKQCKAHPMKVAQVSILSQIYDYFNRSEIEGAESVIEKVKEMLEGLDVSSFILENIEEHTRECIQIANMNDVDISENLINIIDRDFEKYYIFCYYLFQKEKCLDRFFEICDREVKPEDYPKGMGNSLGLGPVAAGTIKLDIIVQYLDKYPLQGKKMIVLAIQSPIIRLRSIAAKALLGWVNKSGSSLAELDSELYALVKETAGTECNQKTGEMWNQLL